ncbi:MAG TPA: fibronectin type III domain-containing protein, partial [Steroidobacteraceae bacterium]|nr:fibronectin type III domain-containing protein [Steroidobacteraceae bacterium]
GVPVTLSVTANDPDGNALTYSATGLPPGLAIGVNIPTITGTPTTAGTYNVAITATDPSNASGSANFIWTIVDQQALILNPMPSQTPRAVNTTASYTASTQNAVNAKYKWFFDDGTPETAYSSSASVSHAFANPGVYYVTVTATDDRGIAQVQTFGQTVYLPATANKPAISSNIAYEARSGSNSRIWVVNQDNDTVTAFDAVTQSKLAEIAVGTAPRTLAVSPGGEIWVTNKYSASISAINANTLTLSRTIALPFASQPFGIAFAPTGGYAYVALEGTGRLLKLDATTGTQVASVAVGANPRQLSVSADGGTVYVSRFVTPHLPGEETLNVQTQVGGVNVGGEVLIVNAGAMTVLNTLELAASTKPDFENQGSGFPNYLGAAAISPDGTAAWVPSKQDNVARGMLRNQQNLNFQSTVRAISSRINLATGAEDFAARLDHDNSSVASAAAYDRYGVYLFVALETSREVAVVDAHGKLEIFRIDVGQAPQGLVVSPDGSKLYVNNFMDRSISVFDITKLVNDGQWNAQALGTWSAVGTEKLTAQVLKGKQIFYDARDTRLARDRYLSCATCHNDGGQDGRVWDLGGFGEGLRNTIALRGRAGMGQGFLHWSANFNEVQDFEAQIRSLSGGTGLMADADFNAGTRSQPLGDPKAGLSADLDALAAYLGSLNSFASSPNRNPDGTLTSDAIAGKAIFQTAGCGSCHSGTAFTESGAATLRNIGTIKPSSGQRLGGPLTGLDTPTLRDAWGSAPYLHDGSAATLTDAIRAHNNVTVSDTDLPKLVAYVSQIGGQEPAAPSPNVAPVVANPGTQSATVGVSTTLAVSATDGNGDALTYSATGLPAGLSINVSSGVITGTPTTASAYSTTVNATDPSLSSGSATFNWNVAADSAPPTAPASLTASAVSGTQINLSWSAATDNAAVTGYEIERCQGAGCSSFGLIGTATVTSFSNTGLTSATSYGYRVRAVDAAGNKGAYSPTASASTPDTIVPSAPASLTATPASASQINLSWPAATDNVAVTNYLIERCQGVGCSSFAQVATSATTSYSNTGLAAATTYGYRVRATDAASNLGNYSPTASAATQSGGTPLTPAFVQRNYLAPGSAARTTVTVAYAAAQTAGNLNVVVIAWNDGTTSVQAVTDTRGHVYRLAVGPTRVAGTASLAIYYAANITASAANANSVTVTFNAATVYPDVRVAEYSGISTTDPLDVAIGATGTGTTANSGSVTTTNANDLLVGGNYIATFTNAAGSGYTSRVITTDGNLLEDRNVTAVGSYNATGTQGSGWWIMQMAAFKAGLSGTSTDSQAPTAPATLTATPASTSQINLSWAAATDNVAVTNYQIERCQGAGCSTFAQIATNATTTYNNTGLAAGTSYTYRVRATDAASNLGAYSPVASATTQSPDTTPPTAPASLTAASISTSQINLSWPAATDNVGVTGYQIERCLGAGCSNFAQVGTSASLTYSNTGLATNTAYTYRVRATDAAANPGAYSPTAVATTQAPPPDTQAPTAPASLTATAASTTQINLSWPAAADNTAVTAYLVERCGGAGCSDFAQIAAISATSYSSTGLTLGTSYSYRVRATDAAANLGPYSPVATASTFLTGTPLIPAFVQDNFLAPGSASRTTVTVPYTTAQSVGNLNVVVVAWNDGTTNVQTVTDTRGNTYRLAVGPTRVSGTASLAIYYASNITAAAANANSVTVTFNQATVYPDIRIAEYSGVATTNPLDVVSSATATGTTANSGSVTTTGANDLLVGGNYVATFTDTPGSGYTSRVITNDGNMLEDRVATTAGSYSATTAQGNGWWIMQLVAFRAGFGP